ncbi:MAG: ATPase [Clostridia bacterium]|jgi:vacuolar-type H+-ATPase subunit H|nr:ATPase [Clostridia bacterium]
MDIEKIIESIEEKIDGCPTIPFWGRGIIDKDELLDMLQEMKNKLPEELSQAKWVNNERQRIINDAQKRAETMIKETEEKIAAMVNEHDITQQAYAKANQIVDSAQQNSREIRLGANQYADDVLRALEEELIKTADAIRANRNSNR